jgi:uncharacterized protein involved in high-affinity Fe2+ transport
MTRPLGPRLGLLVLLLTVAGVASGLRNGGAQEASKTIEVEVENKDVAEVIASIAAQSGAQIVVDKNVHEKVTVSLKKVDWREALDVVARMAHCKVEQKGPVLVVSKTGAAPAAPKTPAAAPGSVAFREYPIGDEIDREKEHLKVAAVWLPPVKMDHAMGDCPESGPNVVHLECDIHATRGNDNGFATGEWIPYLTIEYRVWNEVAGPDEKPVLEGKLMPMVAKDGPHYGSTILMPGPGRYKLTYKIQPPSSGGLGRHTDPVTGVADWWQPFDATYAWDYKGLAAAEKR